MKCVPDQEIKMENKKAATSQMGSLRRLRLLAFDVTVMFLGRKPPWLSTTSRCWYIVHLQLSMTALGIS